MKLSELALLIGGRIAGNPDTEITGVSGIKEAKPGDITYIQNKKVLKDISELHASAFIVTQEINELKASMLVVDNPQFAFARALEVFHTKPRVSTGISDKAFIGTNAVIGDDVSVHPFAYIGNNIVLGARITICPGVFLGEGVTIGDDTMIYPNVTVRENVKIGKNVIIHSGAVLGADGFGYVPHKGTHYKIPQIGGVVIEDNVEIGANVVIDRATTGQTIIGQGTKIDNLVQIAHNVKIDRNCIIVAQAGISGSVEIHDGVILAGQVGVRDHVKVGKGAIIGAQSGVGSDIPEGKIYSGSPAIPHAKWLRSQSIYSKLPEYMARLHEIEKKLEEITKRQQNAE